MSDSIHVAAIAPFWKYAVGPSSENCPAIPFYRLSSAEAFFNEAMRDIPLSGVRLYVRRGFRGIETMREYTPPKATNSEKIIATIEGLESETMFPETATLLNLAKEAQRTGKMPDLSEVANAKRSDGGTPLAPSTGSSLLEKNDEN